MEQPRVEETAVGVAESPLDPVARARALRPRLEELRDVHAESGGYSEEIHREFLAAGFYDILRPRRYGGLELGFPVYYDVIAELARGDAGVAWGLDAGACDTFLFSSYWPGDAQETAYDGEYFLAPCRSGPLHAEVERVEGGYRLSGRWNFCSGATWSTHFLATAPIPDAQGEGILHVFLVRRDQYTVLDDWGVDVALGMQASGSNTIEVQDAFVPDNEVVVFDFDDHPWGETGTPGYRLLGSSLFLGRTMVPFSAGFAAVQVGIAQAALDEYERLLARFSSFPPRMPRAESDDYLRWYGEIISLVDSARALLRGAVAEYARMCEEWTRGGPEMTQLDDIRLRGQVVQASLLAGRAIDLAFTTAGTSSSAINGAKLGRLFNDAATFRTHVLAQWDILHKSLGRVAAGHPAGPQL
ncbi:acyl-CoA dehydrogenase family protein [Microbacterium sp. X-17]|uniref:acyl-CoA dehydrogenase family protein n=1 Tax=Microbacterium sp. X-17 TaxID=3144404 RepID=UPI0031F5799C